VTFWVSDEGVSYPYRSVGPAVRPIPTGLYVQSNAHIRQLALDVGILYGSYDHIAYSQCPGWKARPIQVRQIAWHSRGIPAPNPCWSRMPSSVTFSVSDEGVRYKEELAWARSGRVRLGPYAEVESSLEANVNSNTSFSSPPRNWSPAWSLSTFSSPPACGRVPRCGRKRFRHF
jgi:hypothetical protein